MLQNEHSNSIMEDDIHWFDIDRFFKQSEGKRPIFGYSVVQKLLVMSKESFP